MLLQNEEDEEEVTDDIHIQKTVYISVSLTSTLDVFAFRNMNATKVNSVSGK